MRIALALFPAVLAIACSGGTGGDDDLPDGL